MIYNTNFSHILIKYSTRKGELPTMLDQFVVNKVLIVIVTDDVRPPFVSENTPECTDIESSDDSNENKIEKRIFERRRHGFSFLFGVLMLQLSFLQPPAPLFGSLRQLKLFPALSEICLNSNLCLPFFFSFFLSVFPFFFSVFSFLFLSSNFAYKFPILICRSLLFNLLFISCPCRSA